MATVADVGRREVKIHLFLWRVFLTFRGSTQVDLENLAGKKCTAPCSQGARIEGQGFS